MQDMDAIQSRVQPKVLPPGAITPFLRLSDAQGLWHIACHLLLAWLLAGRVVAAVDDGSPALAAAALAPLALVSSFYFNAFHECVHNTAFRTPALNNLVARVLGFAIFRGAKWFWCFHWTHHRYTQDPERDPELSGGSADLADPTKSVRGFLVFASGWPFGFERVLLMARMACGGSGGYWVDEQPVAMRRAVQFEAAAHIAGYAAIAAAAATDRRVLMWVVWGWLAPHVLGAGHLRLYQMAEHRACQGGAYTKTHAWAAARTTATWWLYRTLAWQMPFHVEHHAWPGVPFHKLPALHRAVRKEGSAPPSGCDPAGDAGYLSFQWQVLRKVFGGGGRGRARERSVAPGAGG